MDSQMAAAILQGKAPSGLDARERSLQRWAEKVVHDPNSVTANDLADLRTSGLSDREIFEATVFIGFRLAFSTINDALGAKPDVELVNSAPSAVREAVVYGRAPA
jgi:alkylhydroperoxidase family enzyme